MSMTRAGLVAVLLVGVAAVTAGAQERATARDVPAAGIDVSRLPLSVGRIQRELAQAATTAEETDGLSLRYQIEVYGQAPAIRLYTPADNLKSGPVPYGAPTHHELLDQITPLEFRSPVMDFSALGRWLAGKARK